MNQTTSPSGPQAPILQTAQKLTREFLQNSSDARPMDDAQIHEVRVFTKKLRALLQLYRPKRDKPDIKAVEKQVKSPADRLARHRDSLVLHQALVKLAEQSKQADPLAPILRCFERLSRDSETAPPEIALQPTLETALRQWHDQLAGEDADDIATGINYSYRKARKLAKKARKSREDAHYHACRKWVKHYLYQLHLVVHEESDSLKKHRRRVKKLARRLGDQHDYSILQDALAHARKHTDDAAELAQAADRALQLSDMQKRKLEKRAHKLFKKVFSSKHSPALKQTATVKTG